MVLSFQNGSSRTSTPTHNRVSAVENLTLFLFEVSLVLSFQRKNRKKALGKSPSAFVLLKQVFQFFTEGLLSGEIGRVTACIKLFQKLLLLGGKISRNLDLYGEVKVAPSGAMDDGYAPSSQ